VLIGENGRGCRRWQLTASPPYQALRHRLILILIARIAYFEVESGDIAVIVVRLRYRAAFVGTNGLAGYLTDRGTNS
jgi:hypothetical protein